MTVVLVTHFMDEAERLCDRLAVIAPAGWSRWRRPAELIADAVVPGVERPTLEDAVLAMTNSATTTDRSAS